MVPKLATTKTFAIVMGLFAGLSLSAPAAEAGMRIYVGFPVGGFYVGGGHYHYHGHKYHWWRYHKLHRLRAIEAERARKAARAEQRRLAALAAARKAAEARPEVEVKEPEVAEISPVSVPLPVKKPDNAKVNDQAALTTAGSHAGHRADAAGRGAEKARVQTLLRQCRADNHGSVY